MDLSHIYLAVSVWCLKEYLNLGETMCFLNRWRQEFIIIFLSKSAVLPASLQIHISFGPKELKLLNNGVDSFLKLHFNFYNLRNYTRHWSVLDWTTRATATGTQISSLRAKRIGDNITGIVQNIYRLSSIKVKFICTKSSLTANYKEIGPHCVIAMWCKRGVQILILAFTMMRSNAMSQPLLNVQNGQNKPNMVGVTRFEPTDRICAGRAKCMKDFVYTHFTVLHSCDMQ